MTKGYNVGEKNASAKLTEDDVRKIRKLCEEGVPITTLSRTFGVTKQEISLIKNRKTWKHVN